MTSAVTFVFSEVEKSGPKARCCRKKSFLPLLIITFSILFVFGVLIYIRFLSFDPIDSNATFEYDLGPQIYGTNLGSGMHLKNKNPTEKEFKYNLTAEEPSNVRNLENPGNYSDKILSNLNVSEDVFNSSVDAFSSFDNTTILENESSFVNVTPKIDMNKNCVQSAFDKEYVKTLSPREIIAVEQLKEKALGNLTYTYCDAISEHFLSRWLHITDWNVEQAKEALLNNLEWRKKEKIDELFIEDFSYFENVFPVFSDGLDLVGRPVVALDIYTVDPRTIFMSGKGPQMLRYLIRTFEYSMRTIREAQFRGENVTQAILISNVQGFNMRQYGCEKCKAFTYKFIDVLEVHYPTAFYKMFVINTPSDFEWVLHLTKLLLPSDVVESIEVYGTNKQEWQEAILKYIPADQIRSEFGGTKNIDGYND